MGRLLQSAETNFSCDDGLKRPSYKYIDSVRRARVRRLQMAKFERSDPQPTRLISLTAALSDQLRLLEGTKGCVVLSVDDELVVFEFKRQ